MRTTALVAFALCLAPPAAAQRAISASDKAAGAKAHPALLREYGGAMRGAQADYVARVGRRVSLQSGLSNAAGDFTVTLLDSTTPNAFAIPGGYVYVTRQLLALMNSEAELAAVLGHEVGHVAARHSSKRNTRSTIGSILAAGVGILTGSNLASQAAGYGAQLYTLGFSRSQEYEADALGVRYIAGAGYDPYAAAAILDSLDADTRLSAAIEGKGGQALPAWASTHPNGPDRVSRAYKLAEETGRPAPGATQDVAFLKMLDGLPYGDDAASGGAIDGRRFRHPRLGLQFVAPEGYALANGRDAVAVSGQGGQAQFAAGPATTNLAGALDQQFSALGGGRAVPHSEVRVGRVGAVETAEATARASADGRPIDLTIVMYRFPAATYRFTMLTPSGSGVGPFRPMVESLAPLPAGDAARIRTRRIRVVAVKPGEDIAALAQRMAFSDRQRERFTVLNGLRDGERLQPGRLVKIVSVD